MIWFLIKVYALIFVVIWVRWTFPRIRFDQLMNFAWKVLIPIALLNLMITAIVLKVYDMTSPSNLIQYGQDILVGAKSLVDRHVDHFQTAL